MIKKFFSVFFAFLVFILSFSGCNNIDVIDTHVDDLVSDYYNNYDVPTANQSNITDTLDLMLDEYVSGLKKPSFDEILDISIEPEDQGNLFVDVDENCSTIDEMKAYIVKKLTETADEIDFYIPTDVYTSEVLYDVIFNQICEEYMIETMGMQKYTVTTMSYDLYRIAVNIDFSYFNDKYSIDEVKDMKKQSLSKAKDIVKNLDLANKTEYERVAAINQYLCDNCEYPKSEPYTAESHSIYGALIEKSAVCEGYARAAQLLFSLSDINSYYVTGDTKEGGHAWNIVEVDNQYYQLDVTWNDSVYQPNAYFLITDNEMSLSRTWDRQKYPISANTSYS